MTQQSKPQPLVPAASAEPPVLPNQDAKDPQESEPLTKPEELPTTLHDREIRELFVYLRETSQVPMAKKKAS